jgi:uncharacterized protein (DUF488 family)
VALLTVGHGTAPSDALAARLTGAGVGLLVDIRRFPGSRRHPHLSRAAVAEWLPAAGVRYRWEERLGGRRPVAPDSPDVALRNASFRGYAAWMRTDAFRAALSDVLAERERTALLCSESVWWRCHRRLVADAAVLLHGADVLHLMPDGRLTPHVPTGGVHRDGDVLVYDAEALPL